MSDSFLSRWARRKEAVRAAAQTETPAPDAATVLDPGSGSDEAAADIAAGADAEGKAALDELLEQLPSLDSLKPESDLTAFLQAGVPSALRNAALRRMWSLDPSIRDFVSEAREYAYDWNIPGAVPGFGPLLPSDDVQAMLKRVVDGVLPKIEEESEGTPPMADPEFSQAATEQAPAPPSEVASAGDGEIIALPSSDMPPTAAETIQYGPEAAKPASVNPRLRRHGGAMPA